MPVKAGDMEIIAAPINFLGVNYYNEDAVAEAPATPAAPDGYRFVPTALPKTEMGWDVVPQGLRRVLGNIARTWPVRSLYVTENGAAYADEAAAPVAAETQSARVHDADRVAYYRGHIAACRDAIADGVPLKGYFAWSLLDNFEWAHGYDKLFGLVTVDPRTLARTPKDSYLFYRDMIAGYGLE